MKKEFERRHFLRYIVNGALGGVLIGCAPQLGPYQPKRLASLRIKNCFDTIGHQKGYKPWILGGTCYCTPDEEQLAWWQGDGFFAGKSLSEVVAMYDAKGVKTLNHHQFCNNLCQWGPHVVKGGNCMVPPTPFTANFEEVATGIFRKPTV